MDLFSDGDGPRAAGPPPGRFSDMEGTAHDRFHSKGLRRVAQKDPPPLEKPPPPGLFADQKRLGVWDGPSVSPRKSRSVLTPTPTRAIGHPIGHQLRWHACGPPPSTQRPQLLGGNPPSTLRAPPSTLRAGPPPSTLRPGPPPSTLRAGPPSAQRLGPPPTQRPERPSGISTPPAPPSTVRPQLRCW